ncbi:hypothetical protein C6P45_002845 [Maudiozyma exigua]|uniref:tRNA-5-taurinomethyluridine 2-sulfurtransferase n=1 Tax=Maudiozyma exigua TaxID=34358 RepID=A0A9P7BB95_MAUEX|nr:hypothetical protein C6P45_002845 [Kazachstania exigua]
MILSKYQNLISKRLLPRWSQCQPSKYDNIIIAMSSGVDSSLCASLYSSYPNVRGIYMRNWSNANDSDEIKKNCDEQDWKDAQTVAKYLNISINLVNFEQDYWLDVFEPMLNNYQLGCTPNPDILCNKFVKFGKLNQLLDKKYGKGNYWLVMGHYSRVLQDKMDKNKYGLFRGIDTHKDQSYYLSQVNSNVWSRTLLPMGHLYKTEVREFANELGLPSATKPDSQGICFVNNSQVGKFKNFLKEYIPRTPGNIITIDSLDHTKRIWGQHDGIWSYTIGQKIGISMPQADPKYKGTWFVSEKLIDTNEIVIVKGRDNSKLFHNQLQVGQFEILDDYMNLEQFKKRIPESIKNGTLNMQYRSLQEPIKINKCDIAMNSESIRDKKESLGIQLNIQIESSQRAMAPGQYCCIYDNDEVIGSGPITNTQNV